MKENLLPASSIAIGGWTVLSQAARAALPRLDQALFSFSRMTWGLVPFPKSHRFGRFN
jgi:hypothetical protein